jgi:hypothetical protein
MKAKVLVVLVVLLLIGVPTAASAPVQSSAIAIGQIRYTRFSVCEHPLHAGVFLQYYLTDGCNKELFLYGDLNRGMVGGTIWAEGALLQNGGCTILDITGYSVCQPASDTD